MSDTPDSDHQVAAAHELPDRPAWQPPAANLSELSRLRLSAHGDRPFLTFYDDDTGERVELSYATFDNWAAKTANLLHEELEVSPGETVVTALGNHWTAVVIAFACWRAGACLAPLTGDEQDEGGGRSAGELVPTARAAFVGEEVADETWTAPGSAAAQSSTVVVGGGLGARLAGDPGAVLGQAIAYAEEVMAFADDYEGGDVELSCDALVVPTPAAPAVMTQSSLLAAADAFADWGVSSTDRVFCAAPVSAPSGLVLACLGAFQAGASVVLARAFDPDTFWGKVATERVTLAVVTPQQLAALAEGGSPEAVGSGLRALVCPSPVEPEVVARAESRLGVAVRTGHGLAEACAASALTPAELDAETAQWLRAQPAPTAGCPTRHAQLAVFDDTGQLCGADEEGELGVRGDVLSRGFSERPELEATRFAGGWYHTGETGYLAPGPDGREHVFISRPAETGS
jgi:uncharacterized protein (TIGR03089 family)